MINGLSGQRMLLALAIGIILLIIMVLKTKILSVLSIRSLRASAARWEASVSSSVSVS